jgi:hypothetical protein
MSNEEAAPRNEDNAPQRTEALPLKASAVRYLLNLPKVDTMNAVSHGVAGMRAIDAIGGLVGLQGLTIYPIKEDLSETADGNLDGVLLVAHLNTRQIPFVPSSLIGELLLRDAQAAQKQEPEDDSNEEEPPEAEKERE